MAECPVDTRPRGQGNASPPVDGSAPAWLTATLAYVVVIVYGSLIPLDYQPKPWDQTFTEFRHLRDLDLGVANRADWLANLFLYVPLGFLAFVTASRVSRAAVWLAVAAPAVFAAAACLAVAVEFTQLWFPPRTASQNDIRAELIGSGVGVLAGVVFVAFASALRRRGELSLRLLAPRLGAIYLAALVAYSVLPGDFVVSADEFAKKVNAGRVNLAPAEATHISVDAFLRRSLHIACFAPIGWMAARRNPSRGEEVSTPSAVFGPVLRSAALGSAVASGIELIQLPIFSRESSLLAVFYGVIGSALGGALRATLFTPSGCRPAPLQAVVDAVGPRRLWRIAAVTYAVAIPVVLLAPFTLVADAEQRAERWDSLRRPPFAALYYSTEFEVLTNVLQKGAVFAVLGALVAAGWPGAHRGLASRSVGVVLLGVGLGSAVELAQVYVAAHQPGTADVLIYAFSCWVGFRLATLAGPLTPEGVRNTGALVS